jgi:hypothetical protein
MTFDLLRYAKRHRYRVRNLHDGYPVPPMKPPNWRHDHSRGYWGKEERMDAIIGRYGYVCDEGNGRIGWFLAFQTRRPMTVRLKKLVAVGASLIQEGDTEAGGDAPVELIDRLVEVIGVYRKPRGIARDPT